ncbi:MAG: GNAT family N-acetyltransferase [Chromatiales bacterium]|nr:GNAT family N-acetyltransferase [Chromatiales bacterium]MDX9766789.1 GNAT family N-acetyltransferase [Ectothiorhodospiraceae bacterium]
MTQSFRIREARWPDELPLLRQVREAVFVIEQGVPLEMEWDEMDSVSTHLLAVDLNGVAIGTARLLPDGHIGRLAVLGEWRRHGVGRALLDTAIALANARGLAKVMLNAQTQALAFYERAGFHVSGPEFMEAGIPHIAMEKRLAP